MTQRKYLEMSEPKITRSLLILPHMSELLEKLETDKFSAVILIAVVSVFVTLGCIFPCTVCSSPSHHFGTHKFDEKKNK